jgi:hypothetical protein
MKQIIQVSRRPTMTFTHEKVTGISRKTERIIIKLEEIAVH